MADELFGPYRLEELIGQGGMGEVYRALDTVHDRIVALKRLPAVLAADTEFQARFRAEAAHAARLHEPHVIPIHDFGEIDGRLFIDMRLVEGRDMASRLAEQGPLPPARAVNVVTQVAAALDAAHAAGIVHRDIKPGNILVSPGTTGECGDDEFVYVADFGIARSVRSQATSLTATGIAVGSLAYLAPERFIDGSDDHRSDVYSLGCLLFELLTGRRPFPGEGLAAMINAHLNVAPPRPSEFVPGLPAGLDEVIARAMAKQPDDRYPSAGALAAAARDALAGAGEEESAGTTHTWVPPVEKTPPAAPGARRRIRRNLVMLSALVVGLAVLAGAVLVLGLGSQAASSEIRRDPLGKPGDNPFMPPAGKDQPGVTAPPRSGGPFSGSTPGLYGGTMNNASCDADAMVTFLQANPDKAAAWAEVQGIAPTQIPSYIGGLTPVILRADTAVTNHGFANGHATVVPAVLQAGTAVLVDSYGVPRARCFCGNPLTPPTTLSQPRYVGESWSGFSPASITTVEPAPAPMTELTLVNPVSNEVFHRPIGTKGGNDRPGSTQPPPTQPSAPQAPAPQAPPTQLPAPQIPVPRAPAPEAPRAQAPAAQVPATAVQPTSAPQPPVAHAPKITGYSTYREGPLIYLRIRYADADGDAEGFGFRGANGSGWGSESHSFASPSYGEVSPGQVDYPFNHGCGQANQIETDVEFWIYDSGGRKSQPIVAHLKCP